MSSFRQQAITFIGILSLCVFVGCNTTDGKVSQNETSTTIPTVVPVRNKERVAYLSDLENIYKMRAMTLVVPMNDQSTQPFMGIGLEEYRKTYPMWTDAYLVITDSSIGATVTVSTVTGALPASTNYPFFSVEIPAVYRGTPDSRWNRRMDFTKYRSIGEFLYGNSQLGIEPFNSLAQARDAWNNEGAVWNKIIYAPRFFLIKIDGNTMGEEYDWINSKNSNLEIRFNRAIGDKLRELHPSEDTTIWTPIVPKWGRTMVVNDFITNDLQ